MAAASGPGPVAQPEHLPGEPTNTSTTMLETAASAFQSFKPIKQIHGHLCAFHLYAYDMGRQVESHHFCTHYNQDMRQCVIYDSPEANARLIGIEYIISEKLFGTLPEEEKKLWHTHEYEVKSGILFMPGVPGVAEHAELDEVAKTYGKVFHFWQFDRGDTLPLGPPQLMMSFTDDGQLDPALAADVEKRFGVSFEKNREARKDIKGPSYIDPAANPWLKGKGLFPVLKEVDCKPTTT